MVLPSLAAKAFLAPTRTLRPRDSETSSSYSTGSDGCVVCPTEALSCPVCPDGEECNLKSITCTSCPEYVCVKSTGGSRSSTNTGGIIGGVVGGVAVLILAALFLYYKLVYRKKHPRLADDMDEAESQYDVETGTRFDDSAVSGEKMERPPNSRSQSSNSLTKNHRLSSYESFMRPPGYNKRSTRAGGARRNTSGDPKSGGQRVYGDDDSVKRHSVATTISTTNASNILPIAYIPGVTIRPTKNNTRSIYSYDADSVFSDMAGIDNASIVHGQTRNTAQAVKAQPKLVNVAPIDEEDEDEDDGAGWEKRNSVRMVTLPERTGTPDAGDHVHELDSDSDVDSDIGEIHRANSIRRQGSHEDVTRDDESGSFVLDIGHGK